MVGQPLTATGRQMAGIVAGHRAVRRGAALVLLACGLLLRPLTWALTLHVTYDDRRLDLEFDPSVDDPRATALAFMRTHGLDLNPNAAETAEALALEMERIKGN